MAVVCHRNTAATQTRATVRSAPSKILRIPYQNAANLPRFGTRSQTFLRCYILPELVVMMLSCCYLLSLTYIVMNANYIIVAVPMYLRLCVVIIRSNVFRQLLRRNDGPDL